MANAFFRMAACLGSEVGRNKIEREDIKFSDMLQELHKNWRFHSTGEPYGIGDSNRAFWLSAQSERIDNLTLTLSFELSERKDWMHEDRKD